MKATRVVLLGTRGSAPARGKDFLVFGGATSCVLIHMGGQAFLLDAGSGLLDAQDYLEPDEKNLALLLSHPHLDHLVGLPVFSPLFDPDCRLDIYAAEHGGLSPRQQVEAMISPPLWPVMPSSFAAGVCFHTLDGVPFALGQTEIRLMEGCHPGGSTVFRLSHGSDSVVYATDFEQGGPQDQALLTFARDCSLFLCDAQYSPEEAALYRGYGHSSWEAAARLGEECGAGRTVLIHHAPRRTDAELLAAEDALQRVYPRCRFGRDGEVMV